LQNLESAGISSPSMTSVTEVELSDKEVTTVVVKEAPHSNKSTEEVEENDVEPCDASEVELQTYKPLKSKLHI